jgi:hypothetical protein
MKGCPLIKEVWQSNRLTALAHEIGAAHRNALGAAQASAGYAIEAGEKLIEAKALLRKSRQWQTWLKETGISVRTAQRYMQVARTPPEKRHTLSLFSFTRALDEIQCHRLVSAKEALFAARARLEKREERERREAAATIYTAEPEAQPPREPVMIIEAHEKRSNLPVLTNADLSKYPMPEWWEARAPARATSSAEQSAREPSTGGSEPAQLDDGARGGLVVVSLELADLKASIRALDDVELVQLKAFFDECLAERFGRRKIRV